VFTPIPGVPAAPPTSGLVAAAERPDPGQLPKWELGLSWIPERCGTEYQLAPFCAEPVVEDYEVPRPSAGYYRPIELRIAELCSTLNGPVDEARVRRVAEAQTPFAIARELWTGAASIADPYEAPFGTTQTVNAHLASADASVVGGSAASARVAIGRLEQEALVDSHGQQVFLHVPVAALPQLDGYVYRVGRELYTLAGNVVVADGAYPGTGPNGQPAGDTVWVYATSPVQVLTSPLEIEPDGPDAVDRSTNTRTTWTSRVFAALFDPCVHLATELDLS